MVRSVLKIVQHLLYVLQDFTVLHILLFRLLALWVTFVMIIRLRLLFVMQAFIALLLVQLRFHVQQAAIALLCLLLLWDAGQAIIVRRDHSCHLDVLLAFIVPQIHHSQGRAQGDIFA